MVVHSTLTTTVLRARLGKETLTGQRSLGELHEELDYCSTLSLLVAALRAEQRGLLWCQMTHLD